MGLVIQVPLLHHTKVWKTGGIVISLENEKTLLSFQPSALLENA